MSETPTELSVSREIKELAREIIGAPPKPVTPRRRRRPAVQKPLAPPPPEPIEETVEQRLAATKRKAQQLAREQSIRIPLRLGVSLETHEALVAIAEKVGPAKIPDIAIRCMEIGAEQWGRQLQVKPTGSQPNIHSALHRDDTLDAENHARARAAMEAVVQGNAELEAERDTIAEKLHLPGRRRATAG